MPGPRLPVDEVLTDVNQLGCRSTPDVVFTIDNIHFEYSTVTHW